MSILFESLIYLFTRFFLINKGTLILDYSLDCFYFKVFRKALQNKQILVILSNQYN